MMTLNASERANQQRRMDAVASAIRKSDLHETTKQILSLELLSALLRAQKLGTSTFEIPHSQVNVLSSDRKFVKRVTNVFATSVSGHWEVVQRKHCWKFQKVA